MQTFLKRFGILLIALTIAAASAFAIGTTTLDRSQFKVTAQAGTLLNSFTTGADDTAVVVTLTGVAGQRIHLYSLDARCSNPGTGQVTIADGSILFQTAAGVITEDIRYMWQPGLTANTGATMSITLGTCGVGNTGTLMVQADQW